MPEKTPPPMSNARRVGLAIGIVAVIAAVAFAYLIGRGHKSHGTQGSVRQVGPVALTASGLKTMAGNLNQRIYWVGPIAGDKYEFTRTTNNYVFVRYLPLKVKAGAKGKYLFIATYPVPGALALLKESKGSPLNVAGGKGGIAIVVPGKPTNYHVAFPHVNFQIEVYDPSPKQARTVATSGDITPVP